MSTDDDELPDATTPVAETTGKVALPSARLSLLAAPHKAISVTAKLTSVSNTSSRRCCGPLS